MAFKKKEDKPRGLVDLVFSWSIQDIMNKHLFQDKVQRIPETFSSTEHFSQSFIYPLLEETRAELESNIKNVKNAPTCEIIGMDMVGKDPRIMKYNLFLQPGGKYKPEGGDLIAFTEVKPKCIDDLDRPRMPYCVALVQEADEKKFEDDIRHINILSSKHIIAKPNKEKGLELFAVYLTNLVTNVRIWNALHSGTKGKDMSFINSVLRSNPRLEDNCALCFWNEDESVNMSKSREALNPLGLDESQKAAVLSVIATTECRHRNSVKLIWGPPGTGKTKTIASLLFSLYGMKCRTLTCAPTNVAVVGVTKRFMSLIDSKLMHERYGLGDIVLFGNRERMKIDDHEDLFDVFLDNRVRVLNNCFSPNTGWTASLEYMICLLEDPRCQYFLYLKKMVEDNENDSVKDYADEELSEGNKTVNDCERTFWKKKIIRDLNENRKKNNKGKMSSEKSQSECHERNINANLWTFEEFLVRKFRSIGQTLMHCIIGFCTHMPTICLSEEAVKCMIEVREMIRVIISLMRKFDDWCEGFKEAIEGNKETENSGGVPNLRQMRVQFLEMLRLLREIFSVPKIFGKTQIGMFCLQNARLIFCTASSSAKLNSVAPIELVIIDEAAQLKECESCIPLQVTGLRNAILVGDEKQLPAMVQSKICMKADFGRSLFERLVILGYKKHLLNVQYRMHPSISSFPNREFYNNGIANGENVMEKGYEQRFLKGEIFCSYSFIDINNGKEEYDDKFSLKNMVEAFVVAEIVSQLYQECVLSKKKVRVGCISPYKAQVSAIKERLGNTYSTDVNNTFSVNVRSVDGFQGGEEDVILISTVRCNGRGSVGFLSNIQRANVALTRARYCCWIVGNAATLLNSGSVWKKLVLDAKSRDCFHNADEDKSLAQAINNALVVSGQLSSLFCVDSLLFKMSKWKVCFSKQFNDSMVRLVDSRVLEAVKVLLVKLSNGWRENAKDGSIAYSDGPFSQLMECYDILEPLKLIWSTEILSESSKDFQVIKIWDIVPRIETLKVASELDVVFGSYTWNYISRCLYKHTEGDLTLPMTWPVDGKATSSNSSIDSSRELAHKLAVTTLNDHGPRSYAKRMATGGAAPQRGTAVAAAANLHRRRTARSGSAGRAGGTMLQFTDDAPGLKISPNVVLVMSIGFIAFVAVLYVMGKLYFVRKE